MAEFSASVMSRSREALRVLSRLGRVRAAYVFGSQVEGRPGPWSDIDLAAFIDGVEQWDIRRRAQAMVAVQEACGADVETHLFPSSALDNPAPGSFAHYILRHGTIVDTEDVSPTGG